MSSVITTSSKQKVLMACAQALSTMMQGVVEDVNRLIRYLNSCVIGLNTLYSLASANDLKSVLKTILAICEKESNKLREYMVSKGVVPTSRCAEELLNVGLGDENVATLATSLVVKVASLSDEIIKKSGDPELNKILISIVKELRRYEPELNRIKTPNIPKYHTFK